MKYIFEKQPPVELSSSVYCHNYSKADNQTLFDPKFEDDLAEFPIFAKEDFSEIGEYLKERLRNGQGFELFQRFDDSSKKLRPSKKLIESTKEMIAGQEVFHLLDEQITANNAIIDRARKSTKLSHKTVIIIKGGPGTGKSVIALNALATLLKENRLVYHATGSKSFTHTLQKIVGARAKNLFKYFNNFQHKTCVENGIDVLICDEAHRIRATSNHRYTKAEYRSEIPQIDELIRAAKVSIFFIDDLQIIKPDEVGSIPLIRETASKYDAEVMYFELKTQFRCNGSNGYIQWLENIFHMHEEPLGSVELPKDSKIDFRIYGSPEALHAAIKQKNLEKPNSARMVAGFCWPWSKYPNHDGTLVEDIRIGDFRMTWEARDDARGLAKGIPYWYDWARDPNGVNHAGSIYTIQGFEFDYIGVIVGKDIQYNPETKEWEGHPECSADPSLKKKSNINFLQQVKNIYRILMTRGMKGCYVYFCDEGTREYFENSLHIE